MMQDVKNLARSKSAFQLFVGANEAGGSGSARTESVKQAMGTAAAVILDSASAASSVGEIDQPETLTSPVEAEQCIGVDGPPPAAQ